MLKNEKSELNTRNTDTTDVISSRKLLAVLLDICSDVMMNRQNPNRFAEVLKMCCEVLFALVLK